MNRHRHAMQLIADARPAALDDVPDRPVPSFPDELTAAPPAPRVGRRLLVAGLVPAVAAALVGVAIVVSASHSPVQSPPASEPTAPALTAQGILLAAAEKTTTSAPATGDYWVTKIELRHHYDVGDYTVLGRSEVENWYPLKSGGGITYTSRWLGAGPDTDADKAAWRAAGSPKKWTLPAPPGDKQARRRELPAGPGARDVSFSADGTFAIGGVPRTYAQIQAMPGDPAKLKAYLIGLDEAAGHDGKWTRDELDRWHVEMLFTQSWALLTELPVSTEVRVATYRMLADLPGLTAEGSVRDAKGRTGAAISHTSQVSEDGKVRSVKTRLVLDPESGALLSQEQGRGTSVLLDAHFSNDAPPRP